MMKAYCRSRWAIWLLLATLLATGFLASWLLANSFEIVLNMWFFATAPLTVIVSIDYWLFRREWRQLQDDYPIDPVQITDPLSLTSKSLFRVFAKWLNFGYALHKKWS